MRRKHIPLQAGRKPGTHTKTRSNAPQSLHNAKEKTQRESLLTKSYPVIHHERKPTNALKFTKMNYAHKFLVLRVQLTKRLVPNYSSRVTGSDCSDWR